LFNEEINVRRVACLDALDQNEILNQQNVAIERLASLARGDNRENLSLTSFILQERLELILAHASFHLRRISQDKYELEPLYEGIGQEKRSGLGITVVDRYTAQRRSPQSLSGGETFYASLALALGLAEVVRSEAGGVELGTLFIDEGFGSLDKETLETVLEVLDELRGGNRIVGLISHVAEMKDWAPKRVDVVPSVTGGSSTIVQRY
jgi:exonuclease SbcC